MDIRKDLFKIFQENKDSYDLYEKTVTFIEKTIRNVKGEENAMFYRVLSQLASSINNAGCEERRSEQIQYIHDNLYIISDEYEDYLP